jgi:hypothetical protein
MSKCVAAHADNDRDEYRASAMDVLYATSFSFMPADGLGHVVDDAPTQVRAFRIEGETRQSWVLEGGLKVRKRHMVLELNGLRMSIFRTLDGACRAVSGGINSPVAERVGR